MEELNNTIETVRNKFAPDRRVALFKIDYKLEGNKITLEGESNVKEGVKDLINEFEKLKFEVKNEVNILPDKLLGNDTCGIINLSVANIRSKPMHSSELVTQSLLGTCVNVLKKSDGWYLIQTPDGYISWVDDDGVHLVSALEQESWKKDEKIIITKHNSTVYYEPNVKSRVVSDLVLGDLLKFESRIENFTQISFPDGRTGFVRNKACMEFNSWMEIINATQSSIVSSAMQFMGIPYLWGGTSSKGVDCSGFTKTVYYMNGIILPRDASQQIHTGEVITTNHNFDNLQEGDLLFFGRKKTENVKEKITHVAIYIGNLKYIHSAGRVKINSLNEKDPDFNKYRFNTFIRAKRIIGKLTNENYLITKSDFYISSSSE